MILLDRSAADALQIPFPAIVALPDGACVFIRSATPTDGERLQRMFYRLSPTTIYRWCFLPAARQAHWAQTLANVANLDYHNHYAIVASVQNEIVGIARYDRSGASQEAEFGIVIEDAWQGRGLGKRLLSALMSEARHQQIATFTARILGENRPALRLVSSLFDNLTVNWQSGECEVSGSLNTFKAPAQASRLIS
jgi:RimJ/RimL family protein N-acetyltransferase